MRCVQSTGTTSVQRPLSPVPDSKRSGLPLERMQNGDHTPGKRARIEFDASFDGPPCKRDGLSERARAIDAWHDGSDHLRDGAGPAGNVDLVTFCRQAFSVAPVRERLTAEPMGLIQVLLAGGELPPQARARVVAALLDAWDGSGLAERSDHD